MTPEILQQPLAFEHVTLLIHVIIPELLLSQGGRGSITESGFLIPLQVVLASARVVAASAFPDSRFSNLCPSSAAVAVSEYIRQSFFFPLALLRTVTQQRYASAF